MSRLKREDLERELVELSKYTRKPYVYGYWNGYYHVYIKTNGEMLITGTLRECYDFVKAFIYGIRYAKRHNFLTERGEEKCIE